ncbi:MAG: hypothetical protein HY507_00040 [Candidatus Zambryskibacteria bacterium]|nr:hypothetical protein [Candidatus Zambryskibacteria bacterium]
MKHILFLDDDVRYLASAGLSGEEAEFTVEKDLVKTIPVLDCSEESFQRAFLTKVVLASCEKDFDLVIIGHNDSGLGKVKVILAELKQKTVVVSDLGFTEEIEKQYKKRGCSRFMTRGELALKLREILELGAEAE